MASVRVRMTEVWLLRDGAAIRSASANPNGTMLPKLPGAARLASSNAPKEPLFKAPRTALGRSAGRLKVFSPKAWRRRVAEHMPSHEPLRALPTFLRREPQLQQIFLKT